MLLDIIGPAIVGPSSSHTAGMARLGRAFRSLFAKTPNEVRFVLNSPLFATFRGHGSDRALVGGIMGIKESDPMLRDSFQIAKDKGIYFTFEEEDMADFHPNTVKINGSSGESFLTVTGASVGGGSIRITAIDDFETDVTGKYPSLVILNADIPGALSKIVGAISSSDMNISNLFLSRVDPFRHEALCVVELDNEPDEYLLSAIKRLEVVKKVSYLERLDSLV